MTRSVETWLVRWGPILAAVVALGGWAARVGITAANASASADAARASLTTIAPIVNGLGRLQCQQTLARAELAGIPCTALLSPGAVPGQ